MLRFRPQARGGIASIGEVLRTCLPRGTCVSQERPGVDSAPFRERVLSSLCRGTHLSCRRIQFSLGDPNVSVRRIEASFQERTFLSRHSLRLPLSLGLALVAMVPGTVGSPLDCRFRGWVCVHGQICPVVSSVRKLGLRYVGGSVAQVSFSCRFFEFVLRLL